MSKKDNAALASVLRNVRGVIGTGPVAHIEVRHLHATGDEAKVGSLHGENISGKGVTPESVSDALLDIIEMDSRLWIGTSRYVILFYRPEEREYCARCPVVIKNTTARFTDELSETEPATEKGLVGMSMRHMEAMLARMTAMQDQVMRYMENRDNKQTDLINSFVDRQIRMLQLEQDLIDRKEERTLRIDREKKTDRIVERGVEQLMMMAGPLLSKMLPGKTGQEVSADAMLISLLSSIQPEQGAALAQIFTPEQMAVFRELYSGMRQRYEKVQIKEETSNENGKEQKEP